MTNKLKLAAIILVAVSSQSFAASMADVATLSQQNKTQKALVVLQKLEASKKVATDIAQMTRGRLYFQADQLDKAYASYDLVSKSSDYWFESIEEKAHVMGRKGEFAKALALLQTTFAESFQSVIGPEPYFVAALTDLKICDYSAIFKVTKQFKERFRTRTTWVGFAIFTFRNNRTKSQNFRAVAIGAGN